MGRQTVYGAIKVQDDERYIYYNLCYGGLMQLSDLNEQYLKKIGNCFIKRQYGDKKYEIQYNSNQSQEIINFCDIQKIGDYRC